MGPTNHVSCVSRRTILTNMYLCNIRSLVCVIILKIKKKQKKNKHPVERPSVMAREKKTLSASRIGYRSCFYHSILSDTGLDKKKRKKKKDEG